MKRPKKPQFVYEEGQAVAVIIDIAAYREMLEMLEDAEDLKMLDEMRQKPLHFHRLEDVLDELGINA